MSNEVTPIKELTEEERNALFSGFDDGCMRSLLDDENLVVSLQEKGYISTGENPELTMEGKQYTDQYWYERAEIILEELSTNNDISTVYGNVKGRIDISKHLFYTFIDNLVSIGKINEISRYIDK